MSPFYYTINLRIFTPHGSSFSCRQYSNDSFRFSFPAKKRFLDIQNIRVPAFAKTGLNHYSYRVLVFLLAGEESFLPDNIGCSPSIYYLFAI